MNRRKFFKMAAAAPLASSMLTPRHLAAQAAVRSRNART
jgi:hypothetical protein